MVRHRIAIKVSSSTRTVVERQKGKKKFQSGIEVGAKRILSELLIFVKGLDLILPTGLLRQTKKRLNSIRDTKTIIATDFISHKRYSLSAKSLLIRPILVSSASGIR